MQSHQLCILISALIAFSLYSCQALTCSTGSTNPATCPEGVTQCMVKLDDSGTVTRGCLDGTCTAPNCLTCTTDNCNTNLVCKTCDDSQTGCATTNASAISFNQLCPTADQQCFNLLTTNGIVKRGCAATCATDAADCKLCNSDNCNVGIYPADRRQCYQCDGTDCNTVAPAMLMPCSVYQAENQQCYTIGTSATAMTRGCQTDTGANKCTTNSADAACAFCTDENGCNNQTYTRVLGSCYKCNNTNTCVQEQSTQKGENCAAAIYTQTKNSCYTQLYSDGNVARGCTNELGAAGCNAADNCNTCESSNCNVGAGVMKCLVCRSDFYAPCRQGHVGNSSCETATGQMSMKCFSGEWNGVVIRGCLDDASSLMKYQCENDADTRCEICQGMGCNNIGYNGAGTLGHLGYGFLGLIMLLGRNL